MCFKGTATGFSTLLILEPSIVAEKFDLLYHVVLRKIFLFLTQIHTTFTFYLIRILGLDPLNKFIPTFHGTWPGLVVCSVFNFKQPITHQDVYVFNVYGRTDRKRCEDLLFKTDHKLL